MKNYKNSNYQKIRIFLIFNKDFEKNVSDKKTYILNKNLTWNAPYKGSNIASFLPLNIGSYNNKTFSLTILCQRFISYESTGLVIIIVTWNWTEP